MSKRRVVLSWMVETILEDTVHCLQTFDRGTCVDDGLPTVSHLLSHVHLSYISV